MRFVAPWVVEGLGFFSENSVGDLFRGDIRLLFVGARKELDAVRPSQLRSQNVSLWQYGTIPIIRRYIPSYRAWSRRPGKPKLDRAWHPWCHHYPISSQAPRRQATTRPNVQQEKRAKRNIYMSAFFSVLTFRHDNRHPPGSRRWADYCCSETCSHTWRTPSDSSST